LFSQNVKCEGEGRKVQGVAQEIEETAMSEATVAGSPANRSSRRIFTPTDLRLSRWYYLTALAAALAVVLVALPANRFNDVAQLERLAPQIERAPTLSVEAREMIGRLVTRQGAVVGSDPAQDLRRKAAIERVVAAMKSKEAATVADRGSGPPQD
jgi:hypothetical protein